jgi:uncharacterized membrane protein
MIFGLTPLGVFHTAISLIAIYVGVWAIVRYRMFSVYERLGQVYFLTTFVTAATGLFIFQHGGFGPPHVLAILAILALVAGIVTEKTLLLGATWSRYFYTLCYSTTLLFHAIPGFNESLSRLPPGKPITTGPDDPKFQPIAAALVLLWIAGLVVQFLWLRKQPAAKPAPVRA